MHIVTTLLLQLAHTDTCKEVRLSSKFGAINYGCNNTREKNTAVLILFYGDNYQYNAHRGKTTTP